MRRASSLLCLLWATCALASALAAQGVVVRAARRDTLIAKETITAAFNVTAASTDSVPVTPRIEAPKDWSVLTSSAPLVARAASPTLVIVSVAVPARTAAGLYVVRLSGGATASASQTAVDSVLVRVPERRAIDLSAVDRPAFVVSGRDYTAAFMVRNRGNAPAAIRLSVHSTLGAAAMTDSALELNAEESRVVRVVVQTPAGLEAANDDVLELYARETPARLEPLQASARVTIVPEPTRRIEEYLRVPAQLNVRAATSDAVSPFEAFGRGPLRDGGQTQLDFLFRGPTGPYSAFGERDEYRVSLRAPSWRLRAGDDLYMLSSLTGSAQPGFGGGADANVRQFSFGAFGQQFRRAPAGGSEIAAFATARPVSDARVAVNFVDRAGGLLPGRIASAAASINRRAASADVELARSDNGSGSGYARMARLAGVTAVGSYDIGHVFADGAFSGSQRGSEHNYLTASAQPWDALSLGLNGSTHHTDLSHTTGVPYVEDFDIGALSATLLGRMTLELGSVASSTTSNGVAASGHQRGLRFHGDQETRFAALTLEAEGGRARHAGDDAATYTDVSVGARRSFDVGAVNVWADRYSGGSISKGGEATTTLGGDASVHVGRATDVTVMAYATQTRAPIAEWHSQIDLQISHTLPNGSSVTLRGRVIGGATLPAADQSVAYLQYGIPLQLPVARLRTPGRVYGRVIDASTGRGVSGALVRLGPQVAITDNRGQVAFGGVPGGEHRLSMAQEASFTDAVFVGDPTITVDSARTQPTRFQLTVAQGARLDVAIRRFMARSTAGTTQDSLVDAGPLANTTLVLASGRDTLYRTTNDAGLASFTDVPPGSWVITIRGDAPPFHRFDPDRLELTLAPGETRALTMRLLPRKRDVQMIGAPQELKSTSLQNRH